MAYPGTERLKDEARAAHTAVIDTIREVVIGFDGCVEPDYWEDITEAGNINAQVIEKIRSSDFGLCYFSEPVNGGESQFADNPNVLFEAGMMQALNNSPGARLGGWMPVRENASAGVPFDIAAERIVIVPGAEDNSLDKVEFSKRLRLHVENLVGDQKRK